MSAEDPMDKRMKALEERVAAIEAKMAETPSAPSQKELQLSALFEWCSKQHDDFSVAEASSDPALAEFGIPELRRQLSELCIRGKLRFSRRPFLGSEEQYYLLR